MTSSQTPGAAAASKGPSRFELIALLASMFATIAFSIDAMLPALPQIGQELTPDDINRAQLVVTSFVLGMGVGTLFTGPLSDTFGRKPVILGGIAVYICAALLAANAETLEWVLAARMLQGLGAAGPRVVALAIVRDVYAGRGMAQIMSFVMMVFTLFPALAPSIGTLIIGLSGWRGVFLAFVAFASVIAIWLSIRLPETLPRERRRPFRAGPLWAAVKELLAHPVVRVSIGVQALCQATMFSMISSVQQIYDVSFNQGTYFPIWFGAAAVFAASASFVNARLVGRLGMRRIVTAVLAAQILFSGIAIVAFASGISGTAGFAVFYLWQITVFFQMGMTMGNVNAIAMEPVGHIAGMASSLIGAISTVLAVLMAVPVGLMFDGTPLPLACGVFVEVIVATLLMLKLKKLESAG
ncbi:multidrug effflux MFS transporter [Salipiger sp. PrR002]|uniref:multidrug effflux MFS transporter n=1 Tax=Salipiger sp. PrR002 TaxID=2706489 RepID=UPI0013B6E868|nr:multidrug effflux MFS transporter [Salipiger sp. PrR002]NDV99287.1 multidrug effflux MFS transporter [Salipiger sp. PrR002]NDW55773.1 multidrug effflux MFS transporter [Salipiger sp. PrR004]